MSDPRDQLLLALCTDNDLGDARNIAIVDAVQAMIDAAHTRPTASDGHRIVDALNQAINKHGNAA